MVSNANTQNYFLSLCVKHFIPTENKLLYRSIKKLTFRWPNCFPENNQSNFFTFMLLLKANLKHEPFF